MNKKVALLSVGLLFSTGFAYAQTRVRGKVVGDDGQPVVGATVRVPGTKIATMTDENGHFVLPSVPAGAKHINISYVGMSPQTVSVASDVNVVMKQSDRALGETVITAYGVQKKQTFTGAATQISGEIITDKGTQDFTKALQGEIAGVQVLNTSGQPGTNAKISIRGIGSINGSTTPLYVVDGIPYEGDVSAIDPNEIESLNVLKDATATALYGSRGANGVVLITTKRGRAGKTQVEAEVKYGISARWIPLYETVSSPEQFLEYSWEGIRNQYSGYYDAATATSIASQILFDPRYTGCFDSHYNIWNMDGSQLIDPTTGKFNTAAQRLYTPEKWKDELFRTGQRVDGSVRFSGGNERMTHFTSFGYSKEDGYLEGSDFERFSVRNNVESKVTSWLKLTSNLAYSHMEYNYGVSTAGASNNAFTFANLAPSLFGVYMRDENGKIMTDPKTGGLMYDYGNEYSRPFSMGINPVGASQWDVDDNTTNQFVGNGSAEVRFLKDFRLVANVGVQYGNSRSNTLMNPYYGDGENANGRIDIQTNEYLSTTANQILYWAHNYGGHNLNAFVGHESQYFRNNLIYGRKSNLVVSDMPEFGNAVVNESLTSYAYETTLESYFGQISYDYKNKYFINASLRGDGSSRFSTGHRWGTFGSVGLGWNITSEKFMQDVNWLKNLKLKASWGLLGNQNIVVSTSVLGSLDPSLDAYPSLDLSTVGNMNNQLALAFAYKGNPLLTWEKSSNFNVGVEFNVADIVEGEVDYFHKKTYDMLFSKTVSPSYGYSQLPVNEGSMVNQGIEFNLTAHLVKTSDWRFDFRVNGGWYQNKITEMPIDESTGLPKDIMQSGRFGWRKGGSIYDFYTKEYAGVDPETGVALYNAYYNEYTDANGQVQKEYINSMQQYMADNKDHIGTIKSEKTSDWSDATYVFCGKSAIPTLTGGFGFDLNWRDLTLSATFSYGIGGYAYDYTYAMLMNSDANGKYNWHKDMANRWQKPGDITDVPRLSNGEDLYANAASTRFLTSRSYLNLSNVRLSYNLPKSFMHLIRISSAQIYANGDNLFLLSARKGFFPMASMSGTSDFEAYLPVSSVSFGLKLNF